VRQFVRFPIHVFMGYPDSVTVCLELYDALLSLHAFSVRKNVDFCDQWCISPVEILHNGNNPQKAEAQVFECKIQNFGNVIDRHCRRRLHFPTCK
jgi:hypothetical protein